MNLNKIILAIGIVSLLIGIASRLMVKPIPPIGLEAGAILQFASACFLLSIAISLSECKK
jgi:hypothetical protein